LSQHFDLPFRFGTNGSAVTVEQDSDADILARVTAILSWRKGYRIDRPGLGINDPTHRQGGANLDQIREQLADQDPAAEAAVTRDMAGFSQLVDSVIIDPGGTI
jgi:hypothetical protein